MDEAARCLNCDSELTGRFCSNCGQRRLDEFDSSISPLRALRKADARVAHSIVQLFWQPGKLTLEYVRGRRRKYAQPATLFLLANMIYFVVRPLLPGDTLTTSLYNHTHLQLYAGTLNPFVQRYLSTHGETFAALAGRFDPIEQNSARSLVILMVPMFAIAVAALQIGRSRTALEHLVFSFHFLAWWLIVIVATLGSLAILVHTHLLSLTIETQGRPDLVFSLLIGIAQAVYLTIAFATAYKDTKLSAAVKGLIASALFVFLIIPAYRFCLFLATWIVL